VTAAARGAAHVLTLSAAAKADILKHIGGIAPDAITATHLAVDDAYHPRLGRENDAAVRAKYDLPDQFVFYMGGFDRRKNVQALMQAYTYLQKAEGDRVPLVIAGREPRWGTSVFPNLRAYAQEVGIADNVRWLGYVEEAEKPSLYRLASVTAYPSLYEGFGLPVLEAMACGTPVIALDIPVMAEVAGDGAYLVKDARAMGGALIALLIQEPLRETMINQGLARATAFSWRKTARETLAVYERVMKEAKEAKGGIR
jgi:glycosyltransferase involved in cell wall biosynthesis